MDGFEDAFGDVFHDGEGLGADFLEDEFVVEFEGLAAAAVGKVKGADRHDEAVNMKLPHFESSTCGRRSL